MTATIIGSILAVITGLLGVFTWYNSDKRKMSKLREEMIKLEGDLKKALADRDTVRISSITLQLQLMRSKIRDLVGVGNENDHP